MIFGTTNTPIKIPTARVEYGRKIPIMMCLLPYRPPVMTFGSPLAGLT